MTEPTGSKLLPSRRTALIGAATLIASPALLKGRALAAGQLVVRSSGGAPEDSNRANIWIPFEKETGIRIVPVPATTSKIFAMFKSGNVELDIVDAAAGTLVSLERLGALVPLDYAGWKKTDPKDVKAIYRSKTRVGYSLYATVLGYSRSAFPDGGHPKNWAEFWDVKRFPGPRSLAGLGATPNLEFALMADGVPRDKVYPINLDHAFESLSRIKASVPKFWETGALSAQMLIDREVNASSIWSSRINPAIAAGNPLAYEWTDHVTQVQSYGIIKGSKNEAMAQAFVDFAMQPHVQAANALQGTNGPTNEKAYATLPAGFGDLVPGSAQQQKTGILLDEDWWDANRDTVTRRWQRWVQS